MYKYYCPYCNPKNQFHKKSPSGDLICGLCGDLLLKKFFIKTNQIIAIVASFTLIMPLIYTFVILIRIEMNAPKEYYKANIDLIHTY